MYVVAPITTDPTLTAVKNTGATPATRSGPPWLRPRPSAVKAAYVGALSSTPDSAPEAQNNCQGSRNGRCGAAAARLTSIGTRQTNRPANSTATSTIGWNEKPFCAC